MKTSRDLVLHVVSLFGKVKFWKKQYEGIEFVKHYRAHLGQCLGDLEAGIMPYNLMRTWQREIPGAQKNSLWHLQPPNCQHSDSLDEALAAARQTTGHGHLAGRREWLP